MTQGKHPLRVYGHPASQPSRAVIWACALTELSIELKAGVVEGPSIHPRGQIPVLDDAGFVLCEMPAILIYLATQKRWSDLYPQDVSLRARIVEYLHAHHSITRLATLKLMAPHVLVAFDEPPMGNPLSHINDVCIRASMQDADTAADMALVSQVVDYVETVYLAGGDFIAGAMRPSIADLACFEELFQLQVAGLFGFESNPGISAWLRRMRELPFHDAVHAYNIALGDISSSANTMQRFGDAIAHGFDALEEIPTLTLVP